MKRFVLGISSFLGVLATLATVSMMVAITLDVIVRGIGGASIPGVLELGETVLVAAVFLGMAYTGATNGHIAVDLVTDRLPARVSQWVVAFGWLCTSVILVWMVYATGIRAISSTAAGEARMGLVRWPLWPARWLIVIGLAAMLLIAITNLVRLIKGKEVLGFQSFDTVAIDTRSIETALHERAELSGLTAVNEPVTTDPDPATDPDPVNGSARKEPEHG